MSAWRISALSHATRFQNGARMPCGRSTSRALASPTSGVTQCHAWPENTSGNRRPRGSQASKSLCSISTSAYLSTLRRATLAISALGSTATTGMPRSATNTVALPVPAPTSSTAWLPSSPASATRSSISAGGYVGRWRS